MCELLGMSAHHPASITLSLNEFARHGGETGPHVDGWGVAYYEGPDANLIRESTSAASSVLMSTLRGYKLASEIVIAHIRRASFGPVELRNTHPFRREMGGRVHIFAHNGDLPGIEDRFPSERHGIFSPVGSTDSEYAFCLLMQRLARVPVDIGAVATMAARKQIISTFAREIGELGPANFLYSDGDALFVHGHQRSQPDGSLRAPGLYTISVSCSHGLGHSELTRFELESDDVQKVTLVSTIPLTDADWKPMHKGQLLVIKGGEIIDSVPGPGYEADVRPLSPTQLACRASSRGTLTTARVPRFRSTDAVSGLAGA